MHAKRIGPRSMNKKEISEKLYGVRTSPVAGVDLDVTLDRALTT